MKIQHEFTKRFKAAENQRQLIVVRDDYHLALAKIGIDPTGPESIVLVDKTSANTNTRPESSPAPKHLWKSVVLVVAAGGCVLLSLVYLWVAIRSFVSYHARRVYHRQNSA